MPLQIGRRSLAAALRSRAGSGTSGPRVAIVGAGLSGLGMAVQLELAGFSDYTLFEKSDEVGGTWRDNTYPGSGCDVPSHLYSFSFATKSDWSRKYAEQPEILGYAQALAGSHGIRSHIRFGAEVISLRYRDETGTWMLEVDRCEPGASTARSHDRVREEFEADFVIAACGQLNRPSTPDIRGIEDFDGPVFHSARWDHSVDLASRDVAVVGNGASAIQFVPPVAAVAKRVTIFQRSPNYVAPKIDKAYKPWWHWTLAHITPAERLYRWSIYWRLELRFFAFRRGAWMGKLIENRFSREVRKALVSEELPEPALIPDFPVGCKRILLSSDWYPTILQPHVHVVSSPISRIERDGVVTEDGLHHPATALIFATGFDTLDFLAPIEVKGRDGVDLHETWRAGAEANLGMTVAGFPNLFLLYGPNTNLGHNSILFMVERQIDYISQCLAAMVRGDLESIEVRREPMERFNHSVQEKMRRTAWAGSCRSWYKTASGKVTNNWPGFTVRYWLETLRPKMDDFVLDSSEGPRQRSGAVFVAELAEAHSDEA
ncbi:MAG TPA: NAD(P)/FAD-dependent oxidoreductase [Acidimicrobiales bacterium]|nr:NAD(P)/FAD-dependent oxidoreductase [Acidimicrobiales bacterium]